MFTLVSLIVALYSLMGLIQPVSLEEPHMSVKVDGEPFQVRTVDMLDTPQRLFFIRKVYGLLTLQIALAATIVVAMMRSTTLQVMVAPLIGCFNCLGLFSLIFCLILRKTPGWNLAFFLVFTITTGITTGHICSIVSKTKGENVVVRAFAATMVVLVTMTVYVMFSTTDFSFLGPFCFVGLDLLIWDCLIFACLGYKPSWWAWFGALVFTTYLIYDTNQIMRRYSTDEFVVAALELYLDVLNLFIEFLKIFADLSKDRRN